MRNDLAIEIETARLLESGHFELGTTFEFQTSSDGEEYALPMAIEFGVFHHLEALIEPAPDWPNATEGMLEVAWQNQQAP